MGTLGITLIFSWHAGKVGRKSKCNMKYPVGVIVFIRRIAVWTILVVSSYGLDVLRQGRLTKNHKENALWMNSIIDVRGHVLCNKLVLFRSILDAHIDHLVLREFL